MSNGDGLLRRVLVVDEDAGVRVLVSAALRAEGFDTSTACSMPAALSVIATDNPELIVLDVGLTGLDGLQNLIRLRAAGSMVPIIVLTARDTCTDRVVGVHGAATDWVGKPLRGQQVVARVHAVLRRTMPDCTSSGGVLQVADLSLDHHSHEVRRGDRDIRLSATEFTLLRYLMLNHHIVVSKAEILNAVWNYDFGGQSNIVELYVGYLRRKLDHTEPKLIHTVRGAGYVIRAPLPGPHGCPASPSPLYRAQEANGDVGL